MTIGGAERADWWQRPAVVLLLLAALVVPLLAPSIPPLSDLMGHMGRWWVSMAVGRSAALQRYYAFDWHLVGNLGLDLLVPPVARLIGIEAATKLLVAAIPPLTGAAMLLVAKGVHGRVPPTALFALPLAYAWPFQLGFVNFVLAQALALLAFAGWLRWRGAAARAVLLLVASWICWIAHEFGWAILLLLVAGAAFAGARGRWPMRGLAGARAVLPGLTPALYMLAFHSQAARANTLGDWLNLPLKAFWVLWILRDRWAIADMGSVALLALLVYAGARDRRLGLAPALVWPALLCFASFLILPRIMLGGAYVDMRMAPITLMLLVLAIRSPREERFAGALALGGVAFLALRIALGTASFAERGAVQSRELAAIDHIAPGSAVLTLVRRPCLDDWADMRRDHYGSMALIRRDAFSNDQWQIDGQQLLKVVYDVPVAWREDPSEFVLPPACASVGSKLPEALYRFPRDRFDYVWTVGTPPMAGPRDLVPVWSDGLSALYRVRRGQAALSMPRSPSLR